MDILRQMAELIWKWLENAPFEFTALFSRLALIMVSCIGLGQLLRELAKKGLRDTFALQLADLMGSVFLGVLFPMYKVCAWTENSRVTLFVFAFCCCLILPPVAVQFIIR